MTTKKTDDMTDRGNYNLAPYRTDDCWQATFRGVDGDIFLGTFDYQEEGEKVIADSIAGAREFAKEEECRRQHEGEERVAAARIPPAYRGVSLDDCPAARDYVKDFAVDNHTVVFGNADAANLKVGCSILEALARQGRSTLYVTINDILATRLSELTAPDLLLIDWKGSESSKIAKEVESILRAREVKPTMLIAEMPKERLNALLEGASNDIPWQRFAGTEQQYRLAAYGWPCGAVTYLRERKENMFGGTYVPQAVIEALEIIDAHGQALLKEIVKAGS